MKVELNTEHIEFINNLISNIDTQNNHSTAKPIIYIIKEDEYVYHDDDDDGLELVAIPENDYDNEYSDIDDLLCFCEDNGYDASILKMIERSEYMEDFKELYDKSYHYDITFKYRAKSHRMSDHHANFFFTQEAAENFIESNKHNLNNPSWFIHHAYRNYEINNIVDILKDIHKQLLNK